MQVLPAYAGDDPIVKAIQVVQEQRSLLRCGRKHQRGNDSANRNLEWRVAIHLPLGVCRQQLRYSLGLGAGADVGGWHGRG